MISLRTKAIKMLIQEFPPLDWALRRIEDLEQKQTLSDQARAKILTLALPIFEIYTSINQFSLSSHSVYLSLKRICRVYAASFIKEMCTQLQGKNKDLLYCLTILGVIIATSVILGINPIIILYASLLILLPLLSLSIFLPIIILGLFIMEVGENPEHALNILKANSKAVLALLNSVIAPLVGLISADTNRIYHESTGLIATTPFDFNGLKHVANHLSSSIAFNTVAPVKLNRDLLIKHLGRIAHARLNQIEITKFIEIIEQPNLIYHFAHSQPEILKEISQLRHKMIRHSSRSLRKHSVSSLSYLCDNKAHEHVTSGPKYHPRLEVIKALLSKHKEMLIYEALGEIRYEHPVISVDQNQGTLSNKREVVVLSNTMDEERWTFLKYGIRDKSFYQYLDQYPYVQSKLKEMHATVAIEHEEVEKGLKTFMKIIKKDFKNFAQSKEAVEICILLNNFKLLTELERLHPTEFYTQFNHLIKTCPKTLDSLYQLKKEISSTLRFQLHTTLNSDKFHTFSDMDLIFYR